MTPKHGDRTIEATLCRRLTLPLFSGSCLTFAKLPVDLQEHAPNVLAYIKGLSETDPGTRGGDWVAAGG